MASELLVLDFDGLSMTGPDYMGRFLIDFEISSQFPLEAILSESPGDFPEFIRGDPQDRVIPLHIIINNPTQTLIDTLKARFSPSRDPVYLRVQDENGNSRNMLVKSLGLTPWEGHADRSYVASLHAAEPVWQGIADSTLTVLVTGTAQTWTINDAGNERTFPRLNLNPSTLKSNADDFIRRWPITLAWRSELDGVDSQGLGYPVDITNGLWNMAAEVSAGRMQADGDDIRVFVDGVEVDRYLDDINTTGTAVWCSIAFQPARVATTATAMTAGSPGSGGSIVVSDPEGTTAFPPKGTILIATEAITYDGLSATAFLNIRRGQRGTTAAAHSADTAFFFVEHDIMILSNYSAAVSPMAAADRKPIIDLPSSTNQKHAYKTTDGFISPATLRTGQWLRELRGKGAAAVLSRLSQSAGIITVEDALPEAGSPNFDSLGLYTPCFVSTVTLDYEVDHDMLLEVYGADSEGFESLLLRRDVRGENTGATYYIGAAAYNNNKLLTPAEVLSRLSLQGRSYRITGNYDALDSFTAGPLGTSAMAQAFDLQQAERIDACRVAISKSVGSDCTLSMRLDTLGPGGPTVLLLSPATILTADIPTTKTQATVFLAKGVPGDIVRLLAEDYTITLEQLTGSVGNVFVYGRRSFPFYPGGAHWSQSGGPTWTVQPADDLALIVCGVEAEPQGDAALGLGTTVRWRNVTVNFLPGKQPQSVIGAAQNLYLIQGTLENLTTGQALTVFYPCRFDAGPLTYVEIDVVNRSIQYIQSGSHTVDITGAVEPSDLIEWMRLDPGNNTLRWTEPSMGSPGEILITTTWRPRWT